MRLFLPGLLLWASMTEAATRAATAVCSTLHSRYPKHLVWDPAGTHGLQTSHGAAVYRAVLVDYWNAANASNRPACALFPSDAEHVSFAVQTLGAHPSVRFALKGGGHNPNLGFSSVRGGLLIAFRPNSQFVVPAPDGRTVHVGAGANWEHVYSALQPLGKTAVGGRLGHVGVTGLVLGGGLSYLSAQYVSLLLGESRNESDEPMAGFRASPATASSASSASWPTAPSSRPAPRPIRTCSSPFAAAAINMPW